jgi:hypothetical protein
MKRNITLAILLAVVVGAGLLGFTAPGHRVLSALGFATACETGNC